MKKQIKKWLLRLGLICLATMLILIGIVLNPGMFYSIKTKHNNCTIFHDKPLPKFWFQYQQQATAIVSKSEVYDSLLHLDICINDGSKYPNIIKNVFGDAYAWGFYNKVVLMCNVNDYDHYAEKNGYKWNLPQLIAHEMVHCYQYNKLGFWRSNPIARIALWKWEGYPEYVARQNRDQKDLKNNIARLLVMREINDTDWVQFSDGTGVPVLYYKYWLLVQFCMDVKKMTFAQILEDKTEEEEIRNQMMRWYSDQPEPTLKL